MAEHPSKAPSLRIIARASSSISSGAGPGARLASELAEEMARRWQQGERPLAEHYLARYPQLHEQPAAVMQIVCEEICLRQEHGEEVNTAAMLLRFPRWRSQLEVLLECHRLLGAETAVPAFPATGDVLGDFRLLMQLGQGAQGKVFLATQPALADRPVVLKLTPCNGQEHLSLARLQHTHIVPLYLVQDDARRNLRVLCMPYFGGAALSSLLEILLDKPPEHRTGGSLLQALDLAQSRMPIPCSTLGPARQLLARVSYVEAICWIGACLADALQYAHERGLVHLDLKPSNVLLAADGQPMLLDFHLAREPIRPHDPRPDSFGGTPGYMSPEQRAAFEALSDDRPVPVAVDGRSDIYSLGLLFYEALAGTPLTPETKLGRLERCNPQVSVGLADMIAKCLRPNPSERYQEAAALAADLRRHLASQPLKGVSNRSWLERMGKWRRRRPQALIRIALLAVVLSVSAGAGALLMAQYRQRVRQAEEVLVQGRELIHQRSYAEAARLLAPSRDRTRDLPGCADLNAALDRQLLLARQGELTDNLHVLADQIRFLVDAETMPAPQLRTLEAACRSVWEARTVVWQRRPAFLPSEIENQLRMDLLDLAVLWTDLRVRQATAAERNAARREALRTLDEAENLLGPSPIIDRDRQAHALALGLKDRAPPAQGRHLTPQSAWEFHSLGRTLLRQGNLTEAGQYFDQAVRLQPQGFWPNFYQGTCRYRQGRYTEAVQAFRVCIALAPDKAECWYNRALANQALNQFDQARADYEQVLRLQPAFGGAYFNRGVLEYREKRYTEAIADFQRALANGFDPARVHYHLAMVYNTQKDRTKALPHLEQALRYRPTYPDAQNMLQQLRGGR